MGLRLRAGRRAGVLAAAVVVSVAGLGAAGGGGPAGAAAAAILPGGTWGQPQAIPGLAALTGGQYPSHGNAVSCASLGNCTAVGWYESATTANIRPFAATETGGTWGSAQAITSAPSTATATGLEKVSCGAPGYCAASGLYTVNGYPLAYLATEVNGVWSVRTLPGTIGQDTVTESYIWSLACTDAGDCTVVGQYTTTSNASLVTRAFTLDESGGTWGTPQTVTGLPPGGGAAIPTSVQPESVSCSGPGDCTAGGVYVAGTAYVPFLVSESGGTWGSPRDVPGFAALNPAGESFGIVFSVSCPDASDCAVAGTYRDFTSASNSYAVFTADEVGGTWGLAKRLDLPSQASTPYTVTVGCRAAGNCVVTGTMDVPVPSGTFTEVFAAAETSGGGVWGQGQALPGIPAGDASDFQGLSCVPAGDCTVAGFYDDTNGPPFRVFAATIAAGGTTWAVQPVQPAQSIEPTVTALDCPQDGYCTLVENNNGVAQLVTEANSFTPARPRLAWPLTGRPASPASRLHGRPAPPAGWPRRG